MDKFLLFMDILGYISTILVIFIIIAGIIAWLKGIIPVLFRLGLGLARRKIVVFAKNDNLISLKSMLSDSKLFNKKNIIDITKKDDFGKSENKTLFLVNYHDWDENDIKAILDKKIDGASLIVYAPQSLGFISKDIMTILNEERNVVVTNFRGRLLNDIVVSLITTSYSRN